MGNKATLTNGTRVTIINENDMYYGEEGVITFTDLDEQEYIVELVDEPGGVSEANFSFDEVEELS